MARVSATCFRCRGVSHYTVLGRGTDKHLLDRVRGIFGGRRCLPDQRRALVCVIFYCSRGPVPLQLLRDAFAAFLETESVARPVDLSRLRSGSFRSGYGSCHLFKVLFFCADV